MSASYEPEGKAAELERLMAVLYERGQQRADPQGVQRAIRALFHARVTETEAHSPEERE